MTHSNNDDAGRNIWGDYAERGSALGRDYQPYYGANHYKWTAFYPDLVVFYLSGWNLRNRFQCFSNPFSTTRDHVSRSKYLPLLNYRLGDRGQQNILG